MSKGLSQYNTEWERREAISRRLRSMTGGLGYWASVDAQKKLQEKKKNKKK